MNGKEFEKFRNLVWNLYGLFIREDPRYFEVISVNPQRNEISSQIFDTLSPQMKFGTDKERLKLVQLEYAIISFYPNENLNFFGKRVDVDKFGLSDFFSTEEAYLRLSISGINPDEPRFPDEEMDTEALKLLENYLKDIDLETQFAEWKRRILKK